MSAWSDVKLTVELPSGREVKVEFGCYASGPLDEPHLEIDGDVWVMRDGDAGVILEKSDLTKEERLRVMDYVEGKILKLEHDYASEIYEDIYSSAIDHAHDTLEDR